MRGVQGNFNLKTRKGQLICILNESKRRYFFATQIGQFVNKNRFWVYSTFMSCSFAQVWYMANLSAFLCIKSIYWNEINMSVVFLCIYCSKIFYPNEHLPPRISLWVPSCACVVYYYGPSNFICSLSSTYRTKLDVKMTKEWNYMAANGF